MCIIPCIEGYLEYSRAQFLWVLCFYPVPLRMLRSTWKLLSPESYGLHDVWREWKRGGPYKVWYKIYRDALQNMGIAWEEAETVTVDQNHWPMCTTKADLKIKCHHLEDIHFKQIAPQNFTKLIRDRKYTDFIIFSVLCFTIPLPNSSWSYFCCCCC